MIKITAIETKNDETYISDLRFLLSYKGPSLRAIAHHRDRFYLDVFVFCATILAILGGAAILLIY